MTAIRYVYLDIIFRKASLLIRKMIFLGAKLFYNLMCDN